MDDHWFIPGVGWATTDLTRKTNITNTADPVPDLMPICQGCGRFCDPYELVSGGDGTVRHTWCVA